jgi:organic radical activating enzyme
MNQQTRKTVTKTLTKTLTKTMQIIVTMKCPLRCRHCAVGINGEPKSFPLPSLGVDDMERAVQLAALQQYEMVNFVGGEPFLEMKLLAAGAEACKRYGVKSYVTTAPMWAANIGKARKTLAKLPGLDYLILSYDKYHLECLDMNHYENAIQAALEQGTGITFNISYSLPEEKEEALEQLSRFKEHISEYFYLSILPLGNARVFSNIVPLSLVTIEEPRDLDRLERSCSMGSIIIGLYKDVHACCWASAVPGSPFRYDRKRSGNYGAALKRMEKDKNFQLFRKTGLTGSLTAESKEKVFEAVKGKQFVNECHLCMDLMGKPRRELWSNCFGADSL